MRVRRSIMMLVPVLLLALFAPGCGEPRQVTYVDPNGDARSGSQGGTASEPVERYGVDTIERAKSVVRIRSALAVARTSSATDPAAAARAIDSATESDLPFLEPRLSVRDARVAAALRSSLERLSSNPPANAGRYAAEVRRISDALLGRAEQLVVDSQARQDPGFRAALLYETLVEASTEYEAAFDGGTEQITEPDPYRRAYGLVIDATTRQLEAVPENGRGVVRTALDRVARRTLPGPTPPVEPRNPDKVLRELGAVADQVTQYASIDPIFPTTAPATPDQLRSLKRDVAAAVESWERGDRAGALRQLTAADEAYLQPASGGAAAVSTALLVELERGVLVDLPAAMRAEGDVVAVGADLDTDIDEAVTEVEEELRILRDSG